jgi:phosphate-selective porin OprO/OprP
VSGQESPKPANPAADPGNFSGVWLNGMNFTTPNKDWVIHLGGRLQFENVLWDQPTRLKGSAPSNGGIPAATPTSGTGVGALDDGMFFRRVRLRSDGTGYGVVEYQFEVDFEQLNYITYDNLWVGLKDVPFLGTVRIGQHKVPQGIEMIGSDYHLTFLERSSLADAFWTLFAPGVFVSNSYLDKNLVVQTMFHRVQPTQFYNEDFGDGNYASTSRVTYTPIYADDGAVVLHVGGSYQYRTADLGRTIQPGGTGSAIADQFDVVRFRARPEIRDATGIGSVGTGVLGGDVGRFVDSGFLLARNVQTCSPEFLLIYGPFSIQAEGAWSRIADARSIYPASAANRDRGNPTFWGAYVQTSYLLTGEHRGYDRRMATFDRPKVANNFDPRNLADGEECEANANPGTGGWGAWEVGYRFSYIDLDDNGINGGLLRQHTFGLNWYLNDNFKLQANYLITNRSVVAPAVPGTVHGFGMMAQWYY